MNAPSLMQVIVSKQQIPSMIGGYVKGMTNVNDVQSFAYDLVLNYATYDTLDEFYSLDVSDLPDFTRHEFAEKLISEEPDYANEATGADNDAYEKTMLPALLKFLRNTTDRDLEIEFTNAWRDGVTSYMTSKMQELINDALVEYNGSDGFDD